MTDHDKSGFSLRSILNRYIQRRKEARATRQLLELSDPLLRDIGLTRYDVMAALSSPRGYSPAKVLSNAVAENRRMLPANDTAATSMVARAALAA